MQPELRLVRYFVAVAEEGNVTRAAARLRMAQPPLSTAIRQLETQLGTRLLERTHRGVVPTAAGRVLLERGRELLRAADAVVAEVRAAAGDDAALVRAGFSPAGRHGVTPEVLRTWEDAAPGVMVHAREDTTGALLRDVAQGRLDLAVVFCPPVDVAGVVTEILRREPVVVHLREDHPLAGRDEVALADLAGETFVVAGGSDSPGYTRAVVSLLREAGVEPRTVPDPYPDLGTRAVRDGIGVVLYVAAAFADPPAGTRRVPVAGGATLPFHLAGAAGTRQPAADVLRRAVVRDAA